eukprot:gnl/MRDRNA2_/MRDRNA2_105670_c0_seq1.p1 gnl/MRDRNA2_/MRDRNA2_105670_c0~~gnl/MRDRNA2_/MRDRNA2_105670_c0_seq1.p1  ORF type:complete len:854 (-),score=190.38 gnl/MRDRNA2_/MRDRNA2_105670_c0_seq1:76-2637(-)
MEASSAEPDDELGKHISDEDMAPQGLQTSTSEPSLPATKGQGATTDGTTDTLSLSRPITPLDSAFPQFPPSRERRLQSRDGSCPGRPESMSQPLSQGTTRLPKVHSDGLASTFTSGFTTSSTGSLGLQRKVLELSGQVERLHRIDRSMGREPPHWEEMPGAKPSGPEELRRENLALKRRIKALLLDSSHDEQAHQITEQPAADSFYYERLVERLHARNDRLLEALRHVKVPIEKSTLSKSNHAKHVLLQAAEVIGEEQTQEREKMQVMKELHQCRNQVSELKQKIHRLEKENQKLSAMAGEVQKASQSLDQDYLAKKKQSLHWRSKCNEVQNQYERLTASAKYQQLLLDKDVGPEEWSVTMRNFKGTLLSLSRQNQVLTQRVNFYNGQKRLLEVRLKSHERPMAKVAGVGGKRDPLSSEAADELAIPTYECISGASANQLGNNFLTFLTASEGLYPQSYLSDLSSADRSACIELVSEEFAAQVKRMRSIREVLGQMNQVQQFADMDAAMENLSRVISRFLQCDRVSIWMVDAPRGVAWTRVAAARDGSRAELQIPLTSGFVGAAYKTRCAINVPDAYEDERFNREVDAKTGYRTKAVLCQPILKSVAKRDHVTTSVIVVLQVVNKNNAKGRFSIHDEFLLEMIGNLGQVVLANGELQQHASRGTQRRDLLLAMSPELMTNLSSMKQVAAILGKYMRSLFRARTCQMLVAGDVSSDKVGRRLAWVGSTHKLVVDTDLKLPLGGIAGDAATSGQAMICKASDERILPTVDLTPSNDEVLNTYVHHVHKHSEEALNSKSLMVIQWTAEESRQAFAADDGLFKTSNRRHHEVMDKFCCLFQAVVDSWPNPNETHSGK